ncbi:unnamed protein product [Ranitomeya imitator]|uniref:R3H-associated N-terminal domain-containing protein n=1 Tax=Ranitomeya imitator TaxID=111125 RepID=A0ABN9MM98_9NEOB|nr:unnamed protein product [Ranitomeya imitator]
MRPPFWKMAAPREKTDGTPAGSGMFTAVQIGLECHGNATYRKDVLEVQGIHVKELCGRYRACSLLVFLFSLFRLIEDCISPLPSSPSKKTSSAKRKQYYINRAIRNSDLIPKAKGRKSLQRLENNRFLLSLLERDECVADEVDSCICSSPSIFAEACNNEVYIERCALHSSCTGCEPESRAVTSPLCFPAPRQYRRRAEKQSAALEDRQRKLPDVYPGYRHRWSLESGLCDSSPATKQRRCSDSDRCRYRCNVAKCEGAFRIWNDFMNRSGEEQEKLLVYLDQKVRKPKEKVNKCKDERTEHPAYTPEECYQRINRRLRFTLKRRHVPMGTLEVLEEEMLSFFSVSPESVYIAMMENRCFMAVLDLKDAYYHLPIYIEHQQYLRVAVMMKGQVKLCAVPCEGQYPFGNALDEILEKAADKKRFPPPPPLLQMPLG